MTLYTNQVCPLALCPQQKDQMEPGETLKSWKTERITRGCEKSQQIAWNKLLSALTVVCSSMAFTVKVLLVSPYTPLDYISHRNWRKDHIFSSHTV